MEATVPFCSICGRQRQALSDGCKRCELADQSVFFYRNTPPAKWPFLLIAWLALLVILPLILSAAVLQRHLHVFIALVAAFGGVGLMALAIAFVRFHSFVALSERGLTYRCPLGRIRTVTWSELYWPYKEFGAHRLTDLGPRKVTLPMPSAEWKTAEEVYHAVQKAIIARVQHPLHRTVPCCPRCNYDLRGLPVPHACPECGLCYDEQTVVWWGAPPQYERLQWFALLGPLAANLGPGSPVRNALIVTGIVALVFVVFFYKGGKQFIAASAAGVTFTSGSREVQTLPWDCVKVDAKRHAVRFVDAAKRKQIPLMGFARPSQKSAQDWVATMLQMKQRQESHGELLSQEAS